METEKSFQKKHNQAVVGPDEMMAALAKAGYSNTRARRSVLEALFESRGQANPAQLLALGRAHHPALGIVTVYRTLELLESRGLVRKLHQDDGCHTYAPALHDHGHYVICERCHRTLEFVGCDIADLVASVEMQTGFRISKHWLEMFGLCPQCRARGRAAA